MGRRRKKEADIILGAFPRREPEAEAAETERLAKAEVIDLAPFLAVRRGSSRQRETAPRDPA